jgi:hypothetical protein
MKERIMPAETVSIMGIFSSEHNAASAIDRLRAALDHRTGPQPHPQPRHRRRPGTAQKPGGLVYPGRRHHRFFHRFFLAPSRHALVLIVSGKPVVALVPFFIVGFEFTILFAVFGNVMGLISQARLPRFDTQPGYDERFSGDRFGVLARCSADEQDDLTRFFEENGAEIKTVIDE